MGNPKPSAIRALFRGLCPRCREGRIFRGQFAMNPQCPRCGLRYERAHGYFTGAMYVSYGLGIPIIALFTLVVWLCAPQWPLWQKVFVAWLAFVPLAPLVYRFSRVAWIHFDRAIDKDAPDAGDDAERTVN